MTGTYPVDSLIPLAGATFLMGSDAHYPEEAPTHRVGSTRSRSSRCR